VTWQVEKRERTKQPAAAVVGRESAEEERVKGSFFRCTER